MIGRERRPPLKTRDKSQPISKTWSGAKTPLPQAIAPAGKPSRPVEIAELQVVVLVFRKTSL